MHVTLFLAAGMLDFSPICAGGLVVAPGWLPSRLASELRDDARALHARGLFRTSGLRDNTVAVGGPQVYDSRDRLVCNAAPDLPGNRAARDDFERRIDGLRQELCASLGLRSLRCAEQYYSIHGAGSRLDRHLDERHEDTKGERGWTAATRRSISWLLYLCEPGWGEPGGPGAGGELRAFCRSTAPGARCGAHDGDVQLGWLEGGRHDGAFEPVFLDSWVRAPDGGTPLSVLYRVARGEREALTPPFSAESGTWPLPTDGSGYGPMELESAFRAQLPERLRGRFRMTDTVDERCAVMSVAPLAGTLVLFDSAAVPHEVAPVLAGERVALAGWLHEPQQPFPDWFGA
ncbi:hypothetical protein KFE25_003882 [Diacronema lutheri]|uniref:Fe2OG dioxygenase domain-containing protein n=1 Tax=Diacronema lutheri TaxID=2081491 RepID=A0A8J5XNA2_DIALT|nr:hypothetical protein KFE25_003882 [Diacronema lutheri]|mmetsp:Transcript_6762/g.21360  ORF Transcript_6762/g.21360 Transcript_6762/m.21360 type:complete len:346 (-) Transcript_6762:872-1909(-)